MDAKNVLLRSSKITDSAPEELDEILRRSHVIPLSLDKRNPELS